MDDGVSASPSATASICTCVRPSACEMSVPLRRVRVSPTLLPNFSGNLLRPCACGLRSDFASCEPVPAAYTYTSVAIPSDAELPPLPRRGEANGPLT